MPIFLGGTLSLQNRSSEPVVVEAVDAWDPHPQTQLGHAVLIVQRGGEPTYTGFTGSAGGRTIEEEAAGYNGWEDMVPLVGATIAPCCTDEFIVGLQIDTDVDSATGVFRGLVITYRTPDGRRFTTSVPAATGFCLAPLADPSCDAAVDEMNGQFDADNAQNLPYDERNRAGTWNG